MVHAPPTPPPTTSAEIQEAAQASASQQAAQQSSLAGPDPYQVAFPALVDAAGRGDHGRLAFQAEEIDVSAPGGHQVSRLLVIAPLVLAYLIQDQIPPARYALERLPDNLSSTPLVASLATLTQVTHNRAYSRVYSTVGNLLSLVGQRNFFDQDLGSVLTILLTNFADAFRQRTFNLLSKAYSSLPLSLAQEYLGVPEEAIINEANKYKWTYDPSSQILSPKAGSSDSDATRAPEASLSSLATFHFVANSVGNLEA